MKNANLKKMTSCLLVFVTLLSYVPVTAQMREDGGMVASEQLEAGAESAALFNSQSGAQNALTNDQYSAFGLSLANPSEFTDYSPDQDNPLMNYSPVAASQLYVGAMNRTSAYNGYRAVYDTMPALGVANATLSDATQKITGNLEKNPVSNLQPYPSITNSATKNKDNKICAHNTISLSMGTGADGFGVADVIVELYLYTGKDSGKNKTTSYMNLELLKKTKDNKDITSYATASTKSFQMSDIGDDSYKNISVLATGAVTSMAAGDYDGDGKDELAIYFPSIKTGTPPSVKIFDVENGSFQEKQTIPLSDLNSPYDSTQFNFKFKDWLVPVVHLATTSISGKDDLVINASLPYRTGDNYKKHKQSPAIGIYSYNTNKLERVFRDYLSYSYTSGGNTIVEQMRFSSAADSDVNGNGVPELMLAGYRNTFSPLKSDSIGDMKKEVYINFVVWEDGKYKTVFNSYDKLLKVAPKDFSQLDTSYSMMEPVSLAAAKLSMVEPFDYIFAAGAVALLSGGLTGTGEAAKLSSGSISECGNINIDSVTHTYVGKSIAGHFAEDRPNAEQIVVISGRGSGNESITSLVSYDISWVWIENGKLVTTMTNHNYISNHQSNNSGTFLTLCEVKASDEVTYYKYTGKSYGWSAPSVMMALPAIPYWKELPRSDDAGSLSFTVSQSKGNSTGGGFNIGGAYCMTTKVGVGGGLAGNSVKVGASWDLSLAIQASYDYMSTKTAGNTNLISVPGDQDYVLVYAVPMVVYYYDQYLPNIVVDQTYIDNYNENRKAGDTTTFTIGQVIEGSTEQVAVTTQYDFVYTLLTLDEYNSLCGQCTVGGESIPTFDMSKGYSHVAGDAGTYPSSFSAIASYPKDTKKKTLQSGSAVFSFANDQTIGFEFDKSHQIDHSVSVGLQFNTQLMFTLEAEAQLFVSGSFELDEGFSFNVGGSFNKVFSKIESQSVSATINRNNLGPDYTDYNFNITASAWAVEDTDKYIAPLYMGYAVNSDAPPKTPENVYAYGQTANTIVLSWDIPDPGDHRVADEYEVFIKGPGEQYELVNNTRLNAQTQNFIVVTGLSANTKYEFAFKAYKNIAGAEKASGFSAPYYASTQSEGTLSFSTQPSSIETSTYMDVSFNSLAVDTVPSNAVSYQWQEYKKQSGSQYGKWENLKGETGAILSLNYVPPEYDGRIFRVVASSKAPAASVSSQTIYSRAATLYVSDEDTDIDSVRLTLAATGDNAAGYNGEIIAEVNEELTLTATLKGSGEAAMSDETVSFRAYDTSNGNPIDLGSATTDLSGEATVTWTPNESKTYKVAAFYNYTYGESKSRLIYSEVITMHVGVMEDYSYTITYILDGGENDPDNPRIVNKISLDEITLLDATKDHAAFDGWYSDAAMTQAVSTITPAELTGDLTLYAKWMPTEYNITYTNVTSGEHSNPATYTMYDSVVLEDAAREGYEFGGWYRNQPLTSRVYSLPSDLLNPSIDPVNIYAKWTPTVYAINYVLNGGENSEDNPETYNITSQTYTLAAPTRKLLVADTLITLDFGGWYDNPEFTGTAITTIAQGSTGNLTLYAKWTWDKALVYFDTRDHSAASILTTGVTFENVVLVNKNSTVSEPTPPTLNGYTFNGWYTENTYSTLWNFNDTVAESMILYAKWEVDNSYVKVTFDFQDEENPDDNTIAEEYYLQNEMIEKPSDLWRLGYKLAGWYTDSDCTDGNEWNFTSGRVGSTDMTLYAKWEIQNHTVTFDTNGGGAVPSSVIQQGAAVTKPTDPSRSGYTFDGWCVNQACTIYWDFARGVYFDMTLYAKWTKSGNPGGGGSINDGDDDEGDDTDDKWVNPFKDVYEFDWFYEDVRFAYENGIFHGTSDVTYSPYTSMSRAMLVTVLWRLAGSPVAFGTSFSDVPNGQWYSIAVVWAENAGIVSGIGDGLFAPNIEISRQDMVVLLMRYMDYMGFDYKTDNEYVPFTDHDQIAPYAQSAVEEMARLGIIRGRDNYTFDPEGHATRAEVTALLHRIMKAMSTD